MTDGRRIKTARPKFGPYEDDPAKANRLHAARRAAGFASGRLAANMYGWNVATLRAHETATGFIGDEMIAVYAAAFRVDPRWLKEGIGQGPPLDPVREARFRARLEIHGDAVAVLKEGGRRLRLARRMAGYSSVLAAAEALPVVRSTLSAHETGQNALSPETADFYAKAFGCSARWLADGTLPSGLSASAEGNLKTLLDLHDQPESVVCEALLELRGRSRLRRVEQPGLYPRPRRHSSSPGRGFIPYVSAVDLYRARRDGKPTRAIAGRSFGFPQSFLSDVMGCDGKTAVVLAPSPDKEGRSERLLLDCNFGVPNDADRYATIRANGVVEIVDGRLADERSKAGPDGWIVAGRVCAVFARYAPATTSADHAPNPFLPK